MLIAPGFNPLSLVSKDNRSSLKPFKPSRRIGMFFNNILGIQYGIIHHNREVSDVKLGYSTSDFSALGAKIWRFFTIWARILVQVTIYRRLLIGRDGHLDQSEAYDIS